MRQIVVPPVSLVCSVAMSFYSVLFIHEGIEELQGMRDFTPPGSGTDASAKKSPTVTVFSRYGVRCTSLCTERNPFHLHLRSSSVIDKTEPVAMPPRISAPHKLPPTITPCPRTRPRCLLHEAGAPRSAPLRLFHASTPRAKNPPPQRPSSRREMLEWLKGPGEVFRDPVPGRTNYLGAYTREGLLRRDLRPGVDGKGNELPLLEDDGSSQNKLDADGKGRFKDRLMYHRPYPENKNFRSQPVLSEALRDRIYRIVVEEGIDVKSASAAFGVDIRRVAAVVRLKSLEKQWEREVSGAMFLASHPFSVMIAFPLSISLEDITVVTHKSYASLSDGDGVSTCEAPAPSTPLY